MIIIAEEVSHLVWGSVQFAAAAAGLFVVLTDVNHLPLTALPDQVTPHAGDIFKPVTWKSQPEWVIEGQRDNIYDHAY